MAFRNLVWQNVDVFTNKVKVMSCQYERDRVSSPSLLVPPPFAETDSLLLRSSLLSGQGRYPSNPSRHHSHQQGDEPSEPGSSRGGLLQFLLVSLFSCSSRLSFLVLALSFVAFPVLTSFTSFSFLSLLLSLAFPSFWFLSSRFLYSTLVLSFVCIFMLIDAPRPVSLESSTQLQDRCLGTAALSLSQIRESI